MITRSGILESVHAYSKGAMGPALTALLSIQLVAVIVLLIRRRSKLSLDNLHPNTSYSEGLMRFFNQCLVYLVLFYLFGQTLPITSQIFLNEMVSFTPQDYGIYSAPILLIIVILTALFPLSKIKDEEPQRFNRLLKWMAAISALCPLTLLFFTHLTFFAIVGLWAAAFLLCSWLYAFVSDFLFPWLEKLIKKDRTALRRNMTIANFFVHLGFAIMALGILCVENLSTAYDIHLGDGESITLENYIFRGHFLEDNDSADGVISYSFGVYVSTPGTLQHELIPRIDYYSKLETYQTIPATAAGILQDVQVILHKPVEDTDEDALLRMNFFPLMSWIWIGGGLMSAGGMLTLIKRHPVRIG